MHPREPVLFVVGIVISVMALTLWWKVNHINRDRQQFGLPPIRPLHRAMTILWAVITSIAAVCGGLVDPDTFRDRDERHHSS